MSYSTLIDDLAEAAKPTLLCNENALATFKILPISGLNDDLRRFALRINSLGSLYYFIKVVLHRRRLVEHLHKPICDALQACYLKLIIELPRDSFKTTIGSEGFPIWRALPFEALEEDTFAKLGYSPEFIESLKILHNKDIRILIVTEVITNAKKLGRRITFHYFSNPLFRDVFSSIIPGKNAKWTEESMVHARSGDSPNGEGTYDFIGVGGALQSRHYDLIIQDDLVGKKASLSETVMEDTIEYHKLLSGAWDTTQENTDFLGNELIIGNRWAINDLNSWVVENEPDFKLISHDALGGCCPEHPEGVPIFPEELSLIKLRKLEAKYGPAIFSCQYRNRPINPETRVFQDSWLRFYAFKPCGDGDRRIKIVHEPENGETIAALEDLMPSTLDRYMVVDPNHSGEKGRCKHAITVMGVNHKTGYKYLLDVWGKAASYEEFINQIYELGDRWKLSRFWLETVAAQKYLKYHLETLHNKRFMLIKELKTPRSANAKKDRIDGLVPLFFRREVYVRREQQDFLSEYTTYPNSRTVDVLDTLGYQPQIWEIAPEKSEVLKKLASRQKAKLSTLGVAGY